MTWSPVGLALQGNVTGGEFGKAVVLSYDGRRLCALGYGALRVYDRNDDDWSPVADSFVPDVGGLALSLDGRSLVAGDPSDHGGLGAMWVFFLSEDNDDTDNDKGRWTGPRGGKILGDRVGFGWTVDVNKDGRTVAVAVGIV